MTITVPEVPRHRADDLIARIATLKADADARGFGALAYFLGMALSEAELQAQRRDDDDPDFRLYWLRTDLE